MTEQNDMYKILGKIYDNKEDARKALDGLDDPSKALVTPVILTVRLQQIDFILQDKG